MDLDKQIAYWRAGSTDEMETAAILVERGKLRQGMFFAHLSIEKAPKGHVVRTTEAHPPRIHSLVALLRRSQLELTEAQVGFLNDFDVYQMKGRYPDSSASVIGGETAKRDLQLAKELQQWLLSKL